MKDILELQKLEGTENKQKVVTPQWSSISFFMCF